MNGPTETGGDHRQQAPEREPGLALKGYANGRQAETVMTRLLISTGFAALLALGGTAWAQGDEHRERGSRGQAAPASQPAPAAQPAQQSAPQSAPRIGGIYGRGYNPPVQNAPAAGPAPAQNAQRGSDENRRGRAMDRTPDNNNGNSNFGRGPDNNDRRTFGNDRRDFGNDRRAFDNDRRGPDSRRDFSAFHRNFNAPRRYRTSFYNRPRGWYAHRWTFGEILPSLFWSSNYWLNDYYDYSLQPPPPGTVWVRDGEDALLIDRFSGEIIEVAYNIFY